MTDIFLKDMKPGMLEALENCARILETKLTIEHVTRVVFDDERLEKIIQALMTGKLEAEKALPKITLVAGSSESTGERLCRCGKPTRGRAATCGADDCKKAHVREYNQAYQARLKAKWAEIEEVEKSDAPPFVFPPMTVWKIESGPNAGTCLAAWEIVDRLEDLLTEGDKILHQAKGMHTVRRREDGKLWPIADKQAEAA